MGSKNYTYLHMQPSCKKKIDWQRIPNPSKLKVQPGFTIGPPEFCKCTDQTADTGSGFYFCMKATWHAASLMKFALSVISNLQGCCHPRGSKQQDLFASAPTGNKKQQPSAPASATSRKATSSLYLQYQKDEDYSKSRTHSPPRSTKVHSKKEQI